jgi:hypothetical protein
MKQSEYKSENNPEYSSRFQKVDGNGDRKFRLDTEDCQD